MDDPTDCWYLFGYGTSDYPALYFDMDGDGLEPVQAGRDVSAEEEGWITGADVDGEMADVG